MVLVKSIYWFQRKVDLKISRHIGLTRCQPLYSDSLSSQFFGKNVVKATVLLKKLICRNIFSVRENSLLFYTLLNKREETFLMQFQIFREIAHRYVLKIGIEKWHWKYHPVSDFTNFSSNLHEKRCRFDEILQFSVILTNFFVLICKIWFQYHQLLFTFSLLKNVCFFFIFSLFSEL